MCTFVPGVRLKGRWCAERKHSAPLVEQEFFLSVKEDNTHCIATVHQRDRRWEAPGHAQDREVGSACLFPIAVTIIRAKIETGSIVDASVRRGAVARRRDVACVTILQKGSYKVVCSAHDLIGVHQFTLSLAASRPFNILQSADVWSAEGTEGPPPLILSTAASGAGNAVIEYAASRELQGLQQTVGQLANSIQVISRGIVDLDVKVSCLQEIIAQTGPG